MEVTGSKVDLEVDSFDAPIAARVYLDYRNVSSKVINAVKFRVGYIDGENKVRGTFHAPDGNVVGPGSSASQKWRGERVDPRVKSIKIRALQVKFADGTLWESAKMNAVVTPNTTDTTSGAGADGPDAAVPSDGAESTVGPSGAVPTPQVPQVGAGAQSWSGVSNKAAPTAPAAEQPAEGDAGTEPAAAEYESVLKSNKRFGSEQPTEDAAGAQP